MIQQFEITLKPYPRGFHLITNEVLSQIKQLPEKGLFHVFIKHTSAALTLNENADPTVKDDLKEAFNRLVPENQDFYTHTYEGSDDMPAHIKSSLLGSAVTIPISQHKLNLGLWQGLILCEFRGQLSPRNIIVTIFQ